MRRPQRRFLCLSQWPTSAGPNLLRVQRVPRRCVASIVALAWSVGCSESPPPSAHERAAPAIYGDDDRLDVFEVEDLALRQLAERSVMAQIHFTHFGVESPGAPYLFFSETLADLYGVCEDEPFAHQPSAASCSGSLIADDLVLTAGHCVASPVACAGRVWMFKYLFDDADTLGAMAPEDLYTCAEVVVFRYSLNGFDRDDYAVVRLDRPVAPHYAPVRLSLRPQRVQRGDSLITMGFPSGLPLKVDDGGVVTHNDPVNAYFFATTDTFGGSSGGPVFDAETLEQVGFVVRGRGDFSPDTTAEPVCVRARRFDNEAGAHDYTEEIAHVLPAVDALCALDAYRDHPICHPITSCGDGECDEAEATLRTCPIDCGHIDDGPMLRPDASRDATTCSSGRGQLGGVVAAVLALCLIAPRRR